jgi:hypothetical protein
LKYLFYLIPILFSCLIVALGLPGLFQIFRDPATMHRMENFFGSGRLNPQVIKQEIQNYLIESRQHFP